MKHTILTKPNPEHLACVIDARRAYDDRRTAEAMRDGRIIQQPRKHRILNP